MHYTIYLIILKYDPKKNKTLRSNVEIFCNSNHYVNSHKINIR